jgi:hypothetical protein
MSVTAEMSIDRKTAPPLRPTLEKRMPRLDDEEDGMATFDQRGQQVTYQYNAAGNIDVGAIRSQGELVGELAKLHREVDAAVASGALGKGVATDARYQLEKATQQVEKPAPDRHALLRHLSDLKGIVSGVTSLAGLAKDVSGLIEKVRVLF